MLIYTNLGYALRVLDLYFANTDKRRVYSTVQLLLT